MRNIIALNFVISLLIIACSPSANQANDIYRISQEQKLYELSIIWKELSYNFANMDNCPGLDIDSLYRAYMSIVQNTDNDYEYVKTLQRFLANFNNGHVRCEYPDYINQQLGYFPIITIYKDNKLIIDNVYTSDMEDFAIGDEVISINGIPAMDYIEQYLLPYVSNSNKNIKISKAVLGLNFYANLLKNESLELILQNEKGIRKRTLYSKSIDSPLLRKDISYIGNLFLEDSINDFAYVRLTQCNESFHSFFLEHYDKIQEYKNLIVDVSFNQGGSSNVTLPVIHRLIDCDAIGSYQEKTRVNNAMYRAWAAVKVLYYKDYQVSKFYKKNIILTILTMHLSMFLKINR